MNTGQLDSTVKNVFETVKEKTTGRMCITTELRVAQIIATGQIVAALILTKKQEDTL